MNFSQFSLIKSLLLFATELQLLLATLSFGNTGLKNIKIHDQIMDARPQSGAVLFGIPAYAQFTKSLAASYHALHARKIESSLIDSSLQTHPAPASMRPAALAGGSCMRCARDRLLRGTYWRRNFDTNSLSILLIQSKS